MSMTADQLAAIRARAAPTGDPTARHDLRQCQADREALLAELDHVGSEEMHAQLSHLYRYADAKDLARDLLVEVRHQTQGLESPRWVKLRAKIQGWLNRFGAPEDKP